MNFKCLNCDKWRQEPFGTYCSRKCAIEGEKICEHYGNLIHLHETNQVNIKEQQQKDLEWMERSGGNINEIKNLHKEGYVGM